MSDFINEKGEINYCLCFMAFGGLVEELEMLEKRGEPIGQHASDRIKQLRSWIREIEILNPNLHYEKKVIDPNKTETILIMGGWPRVLTVTPKAKKYHDKMMKKHRNDIPNSDIIYMFWLNELENM